MGRRNPVYIVDEDPSARCGLARLLRTSGHEAREFATAEEFLDALDRELPGCVVLTAGLPGLSCEVLQDRLGPHGTQLPIIVISAVDDLVSRRRAREIGAAGFFRKPVDGPALVDAVDWALMSNNADDRNGEG